MEIAPNFKATQWSTLTLGDVFNRDWEIAISVLDSRIRERYIAPVDLLIASEEEIPATQRKFGFAILAIDCLLIETLGAFREGLEKTIGHSKRVFCDFLTSRPKFSEFFSHALAEQFYTEFRCGVLHQAEVGGNSKVWSIGPIAKNIGNSIIINRTEFHQQLKYEFTAYLDELKDITNTQLRINFRKKMDFIARA